MIVRESMADSISGSETWLKIPGGGSRAKTLFYELRARPRPGPFQTGTLSVVEGGTSHSMGALVIRVKALRVHVGGGVTQRD